jgi:hypothetical protein
VTTPFSAALFLLTLNATYSKARRQQRMVRIKVIGVKIMVSSELRAIRFPNVFKANKPPISHSRAFRTLVFELFMTRRDLMKTAMKKTTFSAKETVSNRYICSVDSNLPPQVRS